MRINEFTNSKSKRNKKEIKEQWVVEKMEDGPKIKYRKSNE